MRNAYQEGYAAYSEGFDYTEVPIYWKGRDLDDWQEGWLDARSASFKDED